MYVYINAYMCRNIYIHMYTYKHKRVFKLNYVLSHVASLRIWTPPPFPAEAGRTGWQYCSTARVLQREHKWHLRATCCAYSPKKSQRHIYPFYHHSGGGGETSLRLVCDLCVPHGAACPRPTLVFADGLRQAVAGKVVGLGVFCMTDMQ